MTREGDLQVGSDESVSAEALWLHGGHSPGRADVCVESMDDGVVTVGDLTALVRVARKVMPGVHDESVVLATGGALAGE